MLPKQLLLLCFAVAAARAQNNDNGNNNDDDAPASISFSQSISTLSELPSNSRSASDYSYITYTNQVTVRTSTQTDNSTATSTGTNTNSQQSRRTSTSQQLTLIGGNTQTSNGSASSTSSAVTPTNTIPCNGFPEFCNRRYSNITHVAAHNSAFSVRNNAASNQYFDTEIQLNDGVRMIQGQTHWVNDTVYNCHTSCDLLNAGPWQDQLEIIANWVERHPYDVVTILVGNTDMVAVENYIPAIEASGIRPYLFEPDLIPLHRDQWPTLADMIVSGKRVVLFMDYRANQPKVPYILNEFIHIWETPFSPTDQDFPCTIGRPPQLNETKAQEEFMYLANHNLNTAVRLGALTGAGGGQPLLIPNTAEINTTNGQFDEYGQLENMRLNCTGESPSLSLSHTSPRSCVPLTFDPETWDLPPNFLLVDYYNYGDPEPGSVFEVAARANGVNYTRACCGARQSGAAATRSFSSVVTAAMAVLVGVLVLLN